MFSLILERKAGAGREECRCERETSVGCLLHAPQLGVQPATQACVPTHREANQRPFGAVQGTALDQLSCAAQGYILSLFKKFKPTKTLKFYNAHTLFTEIPQQ